MNIILTKILGSKAIKDLVIIILEQLAKQTTNTLDDTIVLAVKEALN